MRRSLFFVGIVVVISAMLLVIYGIAALSPIDADSYKTAEEILAEQQLRPLDKPSVDFSTPIYGPQDADITVVEFGDFLCLECSSFEESLIQLVDDYGGKVRVAWKDFPNTALHSQSLDAAKAARCAMEQGAFWEYHDLLLANQDTVGESAYAPFAAELGLDLDAFQECVTTGRTEAAVLRDREEGIRLQIDGTPYLFIGERRVSGAITYLQLQGFVNSELERLDREAAAATASP